MIKLSHICLASPSITETRHFFITIFDAQDVYEFQRDGKCYGFFLMLAPGSFIEIFNSDSFSPVGTQIIRHACFQVSSLQLYVERLSRLGIPFQESIGRLDQTRQVMIDGPFGLQIELHQINGESLLQRFV